MADLDTPSKRASGLQFWKPWWVAQPIADGALAQGDRQHIARSYSGILASGAVIPPPVVEGGAGGGMLGRRWREPRPRRAERNVDQRVPRPKLYDRSQQIEELLPPDVALEVHEQAYPAVVSIQLTAVEHRLRIERLHGSIGIMVTLRGRARYIEPIQVLRDEMHGRIRKLEHDIELLEEALIVLAEG